MNYKKELYTRKEITRNKTLSDIMNYTLRGYVFRGRLITYTS